MDFKLGQKVKYVRIGMDAKGKATMEHGEGNVVGINLSLDQRVQVKVTGGTNPDGRRIIYNVDDVAINPTPVGSKKYFDHINAIQKRAAEINENNQKLVALGNAEIEEMNVAYLGAKIKLEGENENA